MLMLLFTTEGSALIVFIFVNVLQFNWLVELPEIELDF